MALFLWGTPGKLPEKSTPAQAAAPRGFFGELAGLGDAGRERKKVTKEYFSQSQKFQKEKRRQLEDFEKDLVKQKEHYFRKSGMAELADRPATKEELANPYIKNRVQEFDDRERHMRKSFDKSQRNAKDEMRKDYHKQLRDVAAQARQGGFSNPQGQGKTHPSLMRHLLGSGGQRDPRNARR